MPTLLVFTITSLEKLFMDQVCLNGMPDVKALKAKFELESHYLPFYLVRGARIYKINCLL